MGLSKACALNHKPLIARSKTYGLDSETSSFLQSYLTERYQCTRIDNALSDWESLIVGVIKGFILKPLPFNIFINDVFFFRRKYDLCDHAYDSSLYTADKPLSVLSPLLKMAKQLVMKLNICKKHIVLHTKQFFVTMVSLCQAKLSC